MTSPSAPTQLTQIAERVDQRLTQLLAEETQHWKSFDPRLSEAIDELARMASSGGKRLRAAFCYWAWRGVHPNATDDTLAIDVGAAFEFLQVFALIHDDIMDNSPTRRGATTIHVANAERLTNNNWRGEPRRFGDGVAILVGDLGHVYADQLVGGISERARRIWNELRIELNLGQYLDMRSAAAGELDYDTARQVAMFKTALYTIVRPLQLGAAMSNDPGEALLEQFDHFGRPLGRAFQLRDDALGLIGDATQLGKPVGDDLREGKPTEIVAHALKHASTQQHTVLDQLGQRDLTSQQVADIVTVLEDTGALANNETEIQRLLGQANQALDELDIDPTAQQALAALAQYVADRDR